MPLTPPTEAAIRAGIDPMDDALRRANAALGHAQCLARDALLIEIAIAIGNVAEPGRRRGIHIALAKFIAALDVPVPTYLPPAENQK